MALTLWIGWREEPVSTQNEGREGHSLPGKHIGKDESLQIKKAGKRRTLTN
jgi:hypothetical protein